MNYLSDYGAPPADERFRATDAKELASIINGLRLDLAHPALIDRQVEIQDDLGIAARAAELMDAEGAEILAAKDEDGWYFARADEPVDDPQLRIDRRIADEAIDWMNQAIVLLDHAHANLRDVGLDRERSGGFRERDMDVLQIMAELVRLRDRVRGEE
jgi:hypothetical protein